MRIFLAGIALAASVWWAACAAAAELNSESDKSQERASLLVRQLGADEFARRERATVQLIELGLPALAPLEQGAGSKDREVRYRSQRILRIVREVDFQRRLSAFAADTHPDHDYGLPAWSAYRGLVGGDADARALFVEMQRAEPELLAAIQQGGRSAADLLADRAQQSGREILAFQTRAQLGSVAALLLAASMEDITLTDPAERLVFMICSQYNVRQSAQPDPESAILRKMMGAWIRRAEGWSAYQSLFLAMQYDVKEGLIPAQKVLADKAESPQVKQYAIAAIAKLGDASHLAVLTPLLDDATVCAPPKGKRTTQLRDVALAASIHLAKQDGAKFGVDAAALDQNQLLFPSQSLGFEDDAQRQAALNKWRKFLAQRAEAETEPAESP